MRYDPAVEPDYAAFAVELDIIAGLADLAGAKAVAARLHDRARRLRWAGAAPPEGDEPQPRWN
ncbi:MAG: hypothetical protein JOZ72_14800 [Alphaproteobacteria bacterium]|nr:hypothetical protein [Alphaproteobacteria bacterium]